MSESGGKIGVWDGLEAQDLFVQLRSQTHRIGRLGTGNDLGCFAEDLGTTPIGKILVRMWRRRGCIWNISFLD